MRPQSSPQIVSANSHRIELSDIDEDALFVISKLQKAGYKSYLVGGGVRDLLVGKKPKDFDIGTDATPRQVKSLFRNCRIIGRRFKLAHVHFRNRKILEVATFRDSAPAEDSDDLLDENCYGTEITDAFRRDLTINGLFYDPTQEAVIDYVGGLEDLDSGVVRIIGEADVRFREDPVRIIRTLRHAFSSRFFS